MKEFYAIVKALRAQGYSNYEISHILENQNLIRWK